MTLREILVIMQNRMISLNAGRADAISAGNLDQVQRIDADIISTQNSIDSLGAAIDAGAQ